MRVPTSILLAFLGVSLSAATPAFAYLTPEQVLLQQRSEFSQHAAAPEEEPVQAPIVVPEKPWNGPAAVEERRAERAAHIMEMPGGENLHGGAPLTPSGPGTIIMLVALAIAGLWTMGRAWKMHATK